MMLTKTAIGAVVGALFGTIWATVGFGWACLVVVLACAGAAIGFLVDRPRRAIDLLERFERR